MIPNHEAFVKLDPFQYKQMITELSAKLLQRCNLRSVTVISHTRTPPTNSTLLIDQFCRLCDTAAREIAMPMQQGFAI
jgi:hypothetical protein